MPDPEVESFSWATLRRVTGLSQRDVSRRLGWNPGVLNFIERGIRVASVTQDQQLRQLYRAILVTELRDTREVDHDSARAGDGDVAAGG